MALLNSEPHENISEFYIMEPPNLNKDFTEPVTAFLTRACARI